MQPDLECAYAGQGYICELNTDIGFRRLERTELHDLPLPGDLSLFICNVHPDLREGKRLVLVEPLEPRVSNGDLLPGFLFLEVIKELLIRFIHPLQAILTDLAMYHAEGRVLLAFGRLSVLLCSIGQALAGSTVGFLAFCDSCVA